MNTRKYSVTTFDALLGFLFAVSSLFIILTVVLVCGDVLNKLVTGRSIFWVQEAVEFSLVWLTFLGSAWVLKDGGHIKMDLLVSRLRYRNRKKLDGVVSFVGAVICLILVCYSAKVTWHHVKTGYKLMTFMAPPSAAIDFIVPVGFLLLSVQFLRQGIKGINNQPAGR